MAFLARSVQTPSSPSPGTPPLSAPSGVERAATLPAVPPMAGAPRSAPRGAPGDRPSLPAAPSTSSPASLATTRAAMTASGALSTPQPLASPRRPVSAQLARSRKGETASREVHAGIPDSQPASSREHTHARIDQRPAARATDRRDGPTREPTIVHIATATLTGASSETATLQVTRAAAPAPTPPEPIPHAEPRATLAASSESLLPAPPGVVLPSAPAIEPLRSERPSPMPEPVAAPRVHIGRLEVIVVAPSQPSARPAQRSSADLASRRYLRNA